MDIYTMSITQKSFVFQKQIKIGQIRRTLFETFINDVIKRINVDEFAKKDIQQRGIVIIDQIDKLVKDKSDSSNSRASDQAVQYDLLPLLDGTQVNIKDSSDKRSFATKGSSYITIDTKNILFVGAGAFSRSKPTDLIVELQGRLPITVEMQKLTKSDFEKILKQTEYSLIQQHQKMLEVEDVELCFTEEAINEIARIAEDLNNVKYNTGARRLRTIIEAVLEDIMFEASEYPKGSTYIIRKKDVTQKTKILYKQKQYRQYLA